jgi:2-octaprenyl-6-methoxyphenol hydroxylase
LSGALDPHVQPIEKILVTDGRPLGDARGGPSLLHLFFDWSELTGEGAEIEPLGYMVENRHLRAALDEAMRARGILRIAPMQVVGLAHDAQHATLELADGCAVRADLIVGADGRRSVIRRLLGIRTVGWSYEVTAIVATVAHERPHDAVAHEFFLPNGPFAILPLKGNRANIVWAEPTPVAQAILSLSAEDFLAELKLRFGDFLGDVGLEGPRFSYPLSLQLAERMTGARVALAGDSAHGIHPIAGQGLNMGLKDVAALAQCAAEAASLGLDCGDVSALDRYQRWRRFDNVTMAYATDLFDRLFSNDRPALRMVRDLGLAAVNAFGPARRFFMRSAGGAAGDLPKLLKGESLAA